MPKRRVSLFRNGRGQALRTPKEFELSSKEAILRKEGDRQIVEPAPPESLLAYLKTLEPLDEDWPEIEDPPPGPVCL